MGDIPRFRDNVSELFGENSAGGSFVFRADQGHEILAADLGTVRFFECGSYGEFIAFEKNSFDNMVCETQLFTVWKEIETQIRESSNHSGYVFFNIRTKAEHERRVVCHFTFVEDETEGGLLYAYLFPHRLDNVGSDFDSVTGLYGKRNFRKYVAEKNKEADAKSGEEYAIIYLNLVNFKLVNIEKGVAEGDECLKVIAEILHKVYEDAYITRISGDHFAVFTSYEGALQKTQYARELFFANYGSFHHVIGKFGIYRFVPKRNFDVESALSQAKIACDYIKYDSSTDIVEYNEELANQVKTREYVVSKIDEAIENEWIKVYYQPVVRSLTGCLCGMESLARWNDPEIGFLSPDQFIGTLEGAQCIHKLDTYVVEKVCACIHDRVIAQKPMVPVSVNLSRLDFTMCDMLQIVEAAVEKYDIPRDYIHIEITESMIASDGELMRNVIENFRKAGYEIWMDDFGSGYSSLNLLKDYQFDTLKLDMNFLVPFNEKSKNIVRSTVTMAKDIGMKTLAEGVETKEHLDFLKGIGCEMIQGYYYGRPAPIEEVFIDLLKKNIPIETRKQRHFYEIAGFHVRATDEPLEIIEDDGRTFKTLFMNQSYQRQIFDRTMEMEEIDQKIYRFASPLMHKYREFAKLIEKTGKLQDFYYTANGSYLCFKGQALAEYSGHYIIKGTINNLSRDQWMKENKRLDAKLRELNYLFEDVLLANFEDNTISPLLGGFKYLEELADSMGGATSDLKKCMDSFANRFVYPDEKAKFIALADGKTIYERVKNSKKGYLEDTLRIKQADGSYRWMECYILMIPGTEGKEYLCCLKAFTEKTQDLLESDLLRREQESGAAEYAEVFYNLMINSNLKFFWKDKEGNFRGVSRAFLDYFGFDKTDDVVGKNNDQMHWHIDEKQHEKMQMEVLKKGAVLSNISTQCIVNGIVHHFVYHKIPLYSYGEICGLVGWFVDKDEEAKKLQGNETALKTDKGTGLMNAHAFMDSMIDYATQYHEEKRDYGLIVMKNRGHQRIASTYGAEFADKVIKEMAKRLVGIVGSNAVLARTKESVFAVLTHPDSEEMLWELADRMKRECDSITEVDKKPVTVRIKHSVKLRSKEDSIDEKLYVQALLDMEK